MCFSEKSNSEEWPRWQSRKTLRSPPPTDTPKLQLFIEQLLMRKTKRSPTTKDIKKEPQRDKYKGREEM